MDLKVLPVNNFTMISLDVPTCWMNFLRPFWLLKRYEFYFPCGTINTAQVLSWSLFSSLSIISMVYLILSSCWGFAMLYVKCLLGESLFTYYCEASVYWMVEILFITSWIDWKVNYLLPLSNFSVTLSKVCFYESGYRLI